MGNAQQASVAHQVSYWWAADPWRADPFTVAELKPGDFTRMESPGWTSGSQMLYRKAQHLLSVIVCVVVVRPPHEVLEVALEQFQDSDAAKRTRLTTLNLAAKPSSPR
ncbi:hypothetical protein VTN00DRAFT_2024 [Thermoascus crustaceus]|uniref:uncharacterized protein n=1 Tax=Thermoascus crustaceus TaxID=5088 RepID=UPI003744A57B